MLPAHENLDGVSVVFVVRLPDELCEHQPNQSGLRRGGPAQPVEARVACMTRRPPSGVHPTGWWATEAMSFL